MDCKELIELSKKVAAEWEGTDAYHQATTLITALCEATETLLAERDAAVEELRGICWCCAYGKKWDKAPEWSKMTTCEHMREQFGGLARSGGKSECPYWEWRGPTPPDRQQAES